MLKKTASDANMGEIKKFDIDRCNARRSSTCKKKHACVACVYIWESISHEVVRNKQNGFAVKGNHKLCLKKKIT